MAASSERSPPPFPEGDEQEPEAEPEDGDSDEGEDIFIGNVKKSIYSPVIHRPLCAPLNLGF
uniref:Sorting nexin N-terminal domain-containing protein n=1 Tax=Scleropages formosus TaxID=113540 RepID=A0A8C9SMX1_SCLFO